jgi:hypothetical protein
MSGRKDVSAAVERLRREAGDAVERQLMEAVARLERSPEALESVEEALRDAMHRVGASVLGEAMALGPRGYKGASLSCSCGARQKYINDRERKAVSLLGSVRYQRAYYWCARCHKSRAPRDEALGTVHTEFTPAVRHAVSLVGAEVPFGRGAQLMETLTGLRVSKRKHREISEAAGASLGPEPPPAPFAGPSDSDLYVSVDGTMAPTRTAWREVKIGAVFRARPDPKGRPQRIRTHYLGDILHAEPFGWRVYRAAGALGLEGAPRIVVLGDGASWIWTLAEFHFPDANQIVDWYHATERLSIVANAAFGDGAPEGRRWVARCRKRLKASRVEAVIDALSALRKTKRKAAKLIREAITYYRNNAERMRYRRFRRRGLFIGSGVVEAACKHIVAQRLKQSGMRWDLDGLRNILYLRLAVLNRQWPPHYPGQLYPKAA